MAQGRRGFGHITKLPSGRYRARYTDPDRRATLSKSGRPTPVEHAAPHTFDTREDAETWLSDERRLLSAGTWTPPEERRRRAEAAEAARVGNTFEVYARAWLEGQHHLRESTRVSYAGSLERHLIPEFGPLPVDEVTTAHVRRWYASYGDQTPTARAHAYQVLAAILWQAEEDELITRSPARVKSGRRAKVKREPEVLTRAELFALADAMPRHHRGLTLVCGMGGLRFGEAVALRRRDVDLEAGTVAVVRTATKGWGPRTTGAPKTDAGKRRVAMPRSVLEALREHLAEQPVTGRDALVFPGKNGQLLAPSALYGREARTETRGRNTFEKRAYGFYHAREVIGRPHLHWHDLRRTAATLGAQAGATVREMQHRLGHTTGDMALRYQAATAERDRAVADALDGPDEHDTVVSIDRGAEQ